MSYSHHEKSWNNEAFKVFAGATIAKVSNTCPVTATFMSCLLALHAADGRVLVFGHVQDCCEHVDITNWDPADGDAIIGGVFLSAETRVDRGADSFGESTTWTFYEITTSKGSLTLSFQGESNGYYSESVDVALLEPA